MIPFFIAFFTKSWLVMALALPDFATRRGVMLGVGEVFGTSIVLTSNSNTGTLPRSISGPPGDSEVKTLVPVVDIRLKLQVLLNLLAENNGIETSQCQLLINQLPTQEREFKSIFDNFSDPLSYKQRFLDQNAFLVYYSRGFDGPGRPSIEDDLPVRQPQQYGARNEAWVGWSEFLAEWQFQQKNPADASLNDLVKPLKSTVSAVDTYLGTVPTQQVEEAGRRLHTLINPS